MADYSTHELTIVDDLSGTVVTRHDTADKAYRHAYKYALANWNTLEWGEPSSDERTVIVEYFERVASDGHWFSIAEPMQLEPGAAVSEFDRLPAGVVRWHCGLDGFKALTKEEAVERHAVIRAAQNAKMFAAAVEKQRGKYPVGWPAKFRPVLDAIREAIDGSPDWVWTFYRNAGRSGVPKGGLVFDNRRHGTEEVYVSVEEFAETVGLAPVKATRAPRKTVAAAPAPVTAIAATELAEVTAEITRLEAELTVHRHLLERLFSAVVAREVSMDLLAEAERLLDLATAA